MRGILALLLIASLASLFVLPAAAFNPAEHALCTWQPANWPKCLASKAMAEWAQAATQRFYQYECSYPPARPRAGETCDMQASRLCDAPSRGGLKPTCQFQGNGNAFQHAYWWVLRSAWLAGKLKSERALQLWASAELPVTLQAFVRVTPFPVPTWLRRNALMRFFQGYEWAEAVAGAHEGNQDFAAAPPDRKVCSLSAGPCTMPPRFCQPSGRCALVAACACALVACAPRPRVAANTCRCILSRH